MNCINCDHCEELNDFEFECWLTKSVIKDPSEEEICDDFTCF